MFYVVKLHVPCLSTYLFCFSVLPSGLTCLQRGFPCNQGIGRYSEFAIECGGPPITSSNGIVYEGDTETLGPATYYVDDTDWWDKEKWAVSNVGYFSGSNNPQYTSSSLSQFTNTFDSELFQKARLSASSLRYYGLGLKNGNYTISL
nr:putative lrr receptor-like serine/threonine-protein kinase [Quercus suber]